MNSDDIAELPEEVKRDLTFVPVQTLDEVLRVALPDAIGTTIAVGGHTPQAGAAAAARELRDTRP
jgi:hypothetical protein